MMDRNMNGSMDISVWIKDRWRNGEEDGREGVRKRRFVFHV